jgi:hypothetical protein
MAPEIVSMEVDCHAYAWHEVDPNYPECGPDNLVRMAEQYGVLIEHLPDHDWAGWAWMYRLTGPRAHLVRLLAAEYAGGVEEAEEFVRCATGTCDCPEEPTP